MQVFTTTALVTVEGRTKNLTRFDSERGFDSSFDRSIRKICKQLRWMQKRKPSALRSTCTSAIQTRPAHLLLLMQGIWSRALGLAIERPKSISSVWLEAKFGKAA